MVNITTVEMEIALLKYFRYLRNIIVPNVTAMSRLVKFETDLIILTSSRYATGVEIKVSAQDLTREKDKWHYQPEATPNNYSNSYFQPFKYFYYAVPSPLEQLALNIAPIYCGVLVVKDGKTKISREAQRLFNRKWTESDALHLAHLGTMRIFGLKKKIQNWRKYDDLEKNNK